MDKTKKMGPLSAMMDFFGRLPSQDLKGFSEECKKLTDKDRSEIVDLLRTEGYNITKD